MGLREILGLPPKTGAKTGAKTAAATGTPEAAAWGKLVDSHAALTRDARFALLTEAEVRALAEALAQGQALANRGAHAKATEGLRKAMALAAKSIMAAGTLGPALDRDLAEAEGLIDGARLLGLGTAVLDPHTRGLTQARALRATDLAQAARLAAQTLAALKSDPAILAARKAQDRVFDERRALEAEIEQGLKTPPETPAADVALRQLAHAARLIGAEVGRLNYMGALAAMETCRAALKVLAVEGPAIAAAVTLRAQVLAARARLDPIVQEARLIHAVQPEHKPVVAAFEKADRGYYGALKAKNFDAAQAELFWLETSAREVLALKAEAEADLRARKAPIALRKAVLDNFTRFAQVADVTPDMRANRAQWLGLWQKLSAALEANDYKRATQEATALLALMAAFKTLADAAQALLDAHAEAVALWRGGLAARLAEVGRLVPRAKALRDAIAAVVALKDKAVEAEAQGDIAAFSRLTAEMGPALDRVDRAKAQDDARAEATRQASALYRPLAPEISAILGAGTATPAFRQAQARVLELSDAARAAITEGEADAGARVEALAKAVTEAKALMEANAAALTAKATETNEALKAHFKTIDAARVITAACLPLSAELHAALGAARDAADAAFRKRRYDAALEALAPILPRLGEAAARQKAWEAALEGERTALETRIAARAAEMARVLGWEEITPAFARMLATLRAEEAEVQRLMAAKAWAAATEAQTRAEAALDRLLGAEAELTDFLDDRRAARAGQARDGAALDTALAEIVQTPEAVALLERLKVVKATLSRTMAAPDWAAARAAWDEAARLLAEWQVLLPQDRAAAPPEAAEINRLWGLLKPDHDIAATVKPVNASIRRDHGAFWAAQAAFFRAYEGRAWALALKLIGPLAVAAAQLASRAAEAQAEAAQAATKSTQARSRIAGATQADLKRLPVKDRVALLEELRAKGTALTPEEKKAQRQIYATMTYDAGFKSLDEGRRGALIDELTQDPEVTGARRGWSAMTTEARMAVLMKVLRAECRVYDIPVPEVRLFSTPGGPEGFFSGSDGTLNLNTHPESGFSDYKEALDTVIHENMHNMQYVLIQRVQEGLLQPGDAEYDQALIFAANLGPLGYVAPAEDKEVSADEPVQNAYQNQPAEMHAWDTGDGVARGILAAGAPPRGLTL